MQVVVTGIGLVTALGHSAIQTWDNLIAGRSGIQRYDLFPEHPDLLLGMLGSSPQALDNLVQTSVQQALVDASLSRLPEKAGVVLGSSRGNQAALEAIARHEMHPDNWLTLFQTSPSAIAAHLLDIQGPILAPRAACATGLWAIAQGADLIRQGLADVVIAGGVEVPITPLTVAGFLKMGALTTRKAAPFDRHRSGFVLGEGAAILILESNEHAQKRQQKSYGIVLGFGSSADGHHVSAPNPDARSAKQAIHQCLRRSQVAAQAIDVIHTHGTGTKLNDANEAKIIQALCPHHPLCTSSKGALGHTLGASGAIGSALCLLGIKEQVFPPCTGLSTVDPACAIRIAESSYPCHIETALCLSFGFGGQNAAIAFSKA